MTQQTLNDQREPFVGVTATDLNRANQNANALNGRTKVYLGPGAWTPIQSGSAIPFVSEDVTSGQPYIEFPAAAGGQIAAPLPAFWDLQWIATDTIDLLVSWEILAASVTGSFAWEVVPQIWRPGIPTSESLPAISPAISVEAGALTAQQRYHTAVTIPFAGGGSLSEALATTPTGYSTAIGGAWVTRLNANDSIRLVLTKASPGTGTNINSVIRLLEVRARIGTTVDAANAMPYRIRNVTVTGGTARAAPNQLTFDVTSGTFTINWDQPITPPDVGGYQIAVNGATFPDPTGTNVQTGRTYAQTGVATGTHTYDIRTVGASPRYLPNTLPVRVTVVLA